MKQILFAVTAACVAFGSPAFSEQRSPIQASVDVVKQLAPSGKIKAAINVSNIVLAQKDPAGGEPRGITVDLARELAKRLDLPLEFYL